MRHSEYIRHTTAGGDRGQDLGRGPNLAEAGDFFLKKDKRGDKH